MICDWWIILTGYEWIKRIWMWSFWMWIWRIMAMVAMKRGINHEFIIYYHIQINPTSMYIYHIESFIKCFVKVRRRRKLILSPCYNKRIHAYAYFGMIFRCYTINRNEFNSTTPTKLHIIITTPLLSSKQQEETKQQN